MLGTQHLWLFVVSGLLLNITPGQDTLYIVGRTLAQGRRAGLLSVLGISTGSVIHTLAAAFGLSAILATSATAFTVVKLAGAGYLVYLGMKLLLERPAPAVGPAPAAVTASDWSTGRGSSPTSSTRRWPCSSWPFCRSLSPPTPARVSCRSCSSARCSCSTARCGAWSWYGPLRP